MKEIKLSILDNFFQYGNKHTISEVCEKPQYGYSASADFENIGAYLVRITDIQDGKVNWNKVPYCQCDRVETYLLKENDILFVRTGGTIGKSFLVKSVPNNAIFASYLIRLRVKEHILPEYLYYFFQSKAYWKQITDSKTGTGLPNVNGVKLAALKLNVPNIEIQQKIVIEIINTLDKIEALQAHQTAQLQALNTLLPNVLHEIFQGK
ncbi:MAG: restriction endonuclease subunit S [Cellulosilyticaceae bacterium]